MVDLYTFLEIEKMALSLLDWCRIFNSVISIHSSSSRTCFNDNSFRWFINSSIFNYSNCRMGSSRIDAQRSSGIIFSLWLVDGFSLGKPHFLWISSGNDFIDKQLDWTNQLETYFNQHIRSHRWPFQLVGLRHWQTLGLHCLAIKSRPIELKISYHTSVF